MERAGHPLGERRRGVLGLGPGGRHGCPDDLWQRLGSAGHAGSTYRRPGGRDVGFSLQNGNFTGSRPTPGGRKSFVTTADSLLARESLRSAPWRWPRLRKSPDRSANRASATVLVVDDESVVRDVVVRYLRHDGFETLEAADGVTARRSIEADRPDLVVLDVMIPESNGLDLCRWIRSNGEPPSHAAHGSGRRVRPHHRARTGANDYVVKPFSPRELVVRIKSILRRVAPAEKPTSDTSRPVGCPSTLTGARSCSGQRRRPHRYRVRPVVVPHQPSPCCVLAGAVVGAGLGIRSGARRRYGHRHSPRPPPARRSRTIPRIRGASAPCGLGYRFTP